MVVVPLVAFDYIFVCVAFHGFPRILQNILHFDMLTCQEHYTCMTELDSSKIISEDSANQPVSLSASAYVQRPGQQGLSIVCLALRSNQHPTRFLNSSP